jgi:hypothetical protein
MQAMCCPKDFSPQVEDDQVGDFWQEGEEAEASTHLGTRAAAMKDMPREP